MSEKRNERVVYLTAGAGGMYCGSCMHDNALAKALAGQGWDIQLVPTYTPIRTDEADVSLDQVFFGGINVFLQQKVPLLRYVPRFLDRFLDNPNLIRRVTSKAMETDAKLLGQLALSMLKGIKGNQRKEVFRLCDWLQSQNTDLLIFTNILIGGCIPEIKKRLGIPVLVTLQGDDVFLDHLGESYRAKCIEQIQRLADSVDAFVTHSKFYKDYITNYLGIEGRKVHVTPLGMDVAEYNGGNEADQANSNEVTVGGLDTAKREGGTIGYLARLAPEKGLHILVDAFIALKQLPGHEDTKLKIAGWLGADHEAFAEAQFEKLRTAGLDSAVQHLGSISRHEKLEFLKSIDVFSVPAVFHEPKGLYALEAMAAGVPVVMPDHACFPEMIEASQGGTLFPNEDSKELANQLSRLLLDPELRESLGRKGQTFVHRERNSVAMANATSRLMQELLMA